VSETNSVVLRIERAISLSCVMNAKFRNQVNVSQFEIDRLKRHIEALEGHVSRVENHAKYLQTLNVSLSAEYESSLSWKLSAPLRLIARFTRGILR
jgi:hypothetical protein